MHSLIARTLLFLVVFTLVVPESYAKRAGSGRSGGRQSSALRHKPAVPPASSAAPTPTPAPIQRAQPDAPPAPAAPAAPAAPQQTLPRQAGSPWGGMLGGALLGLGLGSLMSSDDRQPDTAAQSEGASGSEAGSGASGTSEAAVAAQQAREPVPQNKLGPALLLAVLAVIVFLAVRRTRVRRR